MKYNNLVENMLHNRSINNGKFLDKMLNDCVYYYRENERTPNDYWYAKYKAYISVIEEFLGITIYEFNVDSKGNVNIKASQVVEFNS